MQILTVFSYSDIANILDQYEIYIYRRTIVREYTQQLQNDYFKASKLFANITAFVKIY